MKRLYVKARREREECTHIKAWEESEAMWGNENAREIAEFGQKGGPVPQGTVM